MKKFIVLSVLATIFLTAHSQTIDTAFVNSGNIIHQTKAVAKITPFKVQLTDSVSVTHLAVISRQDDLITSCNFQWFLLDDKKIVHSTGIIKLDGQNYAAWDKSARKALLSVGQKVGVTFQ